MPQCNVCRHCNYSRVCEKGIWWERVVNQKSQRWKMSETNKDFLFFLKNYLFLKNFIFIGSVELVQTMMIMVLFKILSKCSIFLNNFKFEWKNSSSKPKTNSHKYLNNYFKFLNNRLITSPADVLNLKWHFIEHFNPQI